MQRKMNWNTAKDATSPIVVTVADQASLLSDLKQHFAQEKGFSVATLNLDHVVKLRRDPAFRTAYSAHTHVTADGNPIVWLNRLAGQNDTKLIPGSELIIPVCALAAEAQVPVALFGATDDSLQMASAALKARFATLNIVLCLAPPMGFDPEGPAAQDAIDRLRDSGARMVFLALGAPKQERFANVAQSALPQTGFMSIGAGLDFISGSQNRAPQWVQNLALEWVWRLIGAPHRLAGRYAACIALMPRLTLRALRNRKG